MLAEHIAKLVEIFPQVLILKKYGHTPCGRLRHKHRTGGKLCRRIGCREIRVVEGNDRAQSLEQVRPQGSRVKGAVAKPNHLQSVRFGSDVSLHHLASVEA
jgi:hypothetical protein